MPIGTAALRTCTVAALIALHGCATDQPSKPMAPAAKPAQASSASTTIQKARPAPPPTQPAKPAAKPTAPAAAAAAPPKPTPHAKPTAAPTSTNAASAPTSTPAKTAVAPQPSSTNAPTPAAAAAIPAAPATADFSTALLFPDPDPSTAEKREIALCEFVGGRWTPIISAPVQTYAANTRGVTFRAVAVRRMVLPMYIIAGEASPAANPWLIESTGKTRELQGPCATCPSNEPPILTLELRPAAPGTQAAAMVNEPADYGIIAVRAERGRRFTLSYWDNAWKPIGEATLDERAVRIEGVPSKRVLWLKSDDDSVTLPVVP